MSTKNLTDIYILMRNNAAQNRNIYNNDRMDDRVSLVTHANDGEDLEMGTYQTPLWITDVDQCQYFTVKLRNKLENLKEIQDKTLSRPNFDDDETESEKTIQDLIDEISQLFNSAHRILNSLKRESSHLPINSKEKQLALNVLLAMAACLQELTTQFRSIQNRYLNKLKSRQEQSKDYFDIDLDTEDKDFFDLNETNLYQDNGQQLLLLEENNEYSKLREKEVEKIVKSIVDLNDIFKELNQMVLDQGTILDRIDYNIEKSSIQVIQASKQLSKAARYQRKNHKMLCILILATVTMILSAILIITKF